MFKGRYTVENDSEVVVFIIGMKINKLLMFHKWVPTLKAMGPMMKELYQHKSLGFLDGEILLGWKGITLIQYWRSFEQLEAYASGKTHSKTWKNFYQHAYQNESVGIFHETYQVNAEQYEAMYVNMPKHGLGKALNHIKVNKATNRARDRFGKQSAT
jgi:hypothetical protein